MQNDAASMGSYGDFQSLEEHQNSNSSSLYSMFSPYADSLYDSKSRLLMQQQQDMVNRHNLCLTRLRESARESDLLRQENVALRSVNRELNKQLSLLIQASSLQQKHNFVSDYSDTPPFEVANLLRGLCIDHEEEEEVSEEEEEEESPTSVMESERVSLPKSISVRSNGYLKMSQTRPQTQTPSSLTGKGQMHFVTQPQNQEVHAGTHQCSNAQQKVYVCGTKKEEEPLELEVYNQGMIKTELCNKWQETGACPYGDHCQFAHGIDELRPVIRHPRYKTEVCRMVLAGDICPYGHRCHFRHALTDQEKFMGQLKPRAIKVNRQVKYHH